MALTVLEQMNLTPTTSGNLSIIRRLAVVTFAAKRFPKCNANLCPIVDFS